MLMTSFARLLLGTPPPPQSAPPVRILLVRPDERLGNVILTSPLAAACRSCFPDARIDWLLPARFAPLMADNEPGISVLPFDKRWLYVAPWRWAGLLCRLRKTPYDVAIDASHAHAVSRTAMLLTLWSRAPIRIAHAHPRRPDLYTHPVESVERWHDSRRKRELLKPLCADSKTPFARPFIGRIDAASRLRIGQWLSECGLTRPVLLWPGARKADRRVPIEIFAKIAQNLPNSNVVVGWGPAERKSAQSFAAQIGAPLMPDCNPRELAAFCSHCAAYIGSDTGPLHLSVACGVPSACLAPHAEALRWAWKQRPHLALPVDVAAPAPVAKAVLTWYANLSEDHGA